MSVNKVFLGGLLATDNSLRFYDGGQYGFLNMVVSNVPIVVKYGGDNYDGGRIQGLCDRMKGSQSPYVLVADAYMQERSAKARQGGWEVAVNAGIGRFSFRQQPIALNFVYLHGEVKSTAADQTGATWVELKLDYWSQIPGKQGEMKSRTVRVRLSEHMDNSIVGCQLAIWGVLEPQAGGKELLHVTAHATTIL